MARNLGGSNRLLTAAQAAELLGMPTAKSLLNSYRRLGIPVVRLGRSVRFRERDLFAWIDDHVEYTKETCPGGTQCHHARECKAA